MSRRAESLMCASAYIGGFRVKGRAERAVTNARLSCPADRPSPPAQLALRIQSEALC